MSPAFRSRNKEFHGTPFDQPRLDRFLPARPIVEKPKEEIKSEDLDIEFVLTSSGITMRAPALSLRNKKILGFIKEGNTTANKLAPKLELKPSTVLVELKYLKSLGLVSTF